MRSTHTPFLSQAKGVCVCLFALWCLAGALHARPALATPVFNPTATAEQNKIAAHETMQWGLNNTNFREFLTQIIGLKNVIIARFEVLGGQIALATRAYSTAQLVTAKIEDETTQAIIDRRTLNSKLGVELEAAMRAFTPKHDYLCKAIVAHENVTTTEDFERETTRQIAEAVANRYRCPTCDGRGPDYIGKEQARRREKRNPLDGVNTYRSDLTGTDTRSYADADLFMPDGGQIYEMPPTEPKSYIDPVTNQTFTVNKVTPDENNERQMFWMAAFDNIFLTMGARPTPAHGKAKDKPVGKTQRAMFNHCAASENALIMQCAAWLAFQSRPNCATNGALCASQKEKCLGAEGVVDLKRFDNCTKGLSPYEEQLIAQSMCKSNEHYVSMRAAGATANELKTSSNICSVSWITWRALVKKKENNCLAARRGVSALKACWDAAEAAGGGR